MKVIFYNRLNQLRFGWKVFCITAIAVFANFVLRYFIGTLSILIMFSSSKFKSLGIGEDIALQFLLESHLRSNLLQAALPVSIILAVFFGIKIFGIKGFSNSRKEIPKVLH